MRHFYCRLRSLHPPNPLPPPLQDLEQVTSPGLNVVKHELRELLVQVYLLFCWRWRDGLKTMNRHSHDKDDEDSEKERSRTSWEDKLEDEMKRWHLKMFSLFFICIFHLSVCVCVAKEIVKDISSISGFSN